MDSKINRKKSKLLKCPDVALKGSSKEVSPQCYGKNLIKFWPVYCSKRQSIYGFIFSHTSDYLPILLPRSPPSGHTHTRIFPNSVRIHNIVYWLHFCSHPIILWLFLLDFTPCNFPPNLYTLVPMFFVFILN